MKRRACFVAALCAAALALTACSGPDLSSLSSDFPGGESEASSTGEATAEEPAAEEDVGYPVDGYAEGRIGDTMHTYFFDYTVNDAYTCASYEGTTPASGNIFLVVDITVKNTSTQSYNMFDTDFQAQWGTDGEEDYRVPITTDPETYEELDPLSEEQLPGTYPLAVDEEVRGLLVYEVPEGYQDFSISYMEYFDDESTGDTFFVFFTAKEQV